MSFVWRRVRRVAGASPSCDSRRRRQSGTGLVLPVGPRAMHARPATNTRRVPVMQTRLRPGLSPVPERPDRPRRRPTRKRWFLVVAGVVAGGLLVGPVVSDAQRSHDRQLFARSLERQLTTAKRQAGAQARAEANAAVRGEVTGLRRHVETLNNRFDSDQETLASLRHQVDALVDERADLTAQANDLRSRVAGLNARLHRIQSRREVPDLGGVALATVQGTADAAGWTLLVDRRESSAPVGTVLEQTPGPGATLSAGDMLRIVVAKPLPAPPPPPPVSSSWSGGCTPGYSPCLPPASDYDCAGGSGNGPEYTGFVAFTGSDPYGLDSDTDGVGCELNS